MKTRTTVAAILAAASLFTAPTVPAQAGYGCLTESEWDQVHDGLLRSSARSLIGSYWYTVKNPHDDGDGYRRMAEKYPRCNGGDNPWSIIGYRDYVGPGDSDVVWRVDYKVR